MKYCVIFAFVLTVAYAAPKGPKSQAKPSVLEQPSGYNFGYSQPIGPVGHISPVVQAPQISPPVNYIPSTYTGVPSTITSLGHIPYIPSPQISQIPIGGHVSPPISYVSPSISPISVPHIGGLGTPLINQVPNVVPPISIPHYGGVGTPLINQVPNIYQSGASPIGGYVPQQVSYNPTQTAGHV